MPYHLLSATRLSYNLFLPVYLEPQLSTAFKSVVCRSTAVTVAALANEQEGAMLSNIFTMEDVVGKGAKNENVNTTRREAIRLSKLLTASLEKPEDLAFEMGLLVRSAPKVKSSED